ncbi:MAG: hypothetical protein KF781_08565 [Chitinophagaceae bacterium]|nr:hypothetical protein [Chitinophagaceae bacterium]
MQLRISQRTGVSTFAIRTSQHTNQKLQKSFLLSRQENYFLKFLPFKISKTAIAQPIRHTKHKPTMTAKNIMNDKNGSSQQRFGVMGADILRMKFCAKFELRASYEL